MARGVGSLEWARRTHGRLSRRDRLALVAQGVRRQAQAMRPRLGSRAQAVLDVEGYSPPDSAVAQEAEELCREASAPFLEAHCYRTHLWGVAIGRDEGVDFDEEDFYVAALTHDLGLTERFRGHDPEAACFSLDSASGARELLASQGWEGERMDAVAEAITLHLNADVPLSQGAEAYLLQLGAAVDVTGFRLSDLDRVTRQAVLAAHPRHGMKAEFVSLMHREVREHPDSRPAFFTRRFRFDRMVERAPFDD
jgi:HD domain-containing protein